MISKLKTRPYVVYAVILLLLVLVAGCSSPARAPVAVSDTAEQGASAGVAEEAIEAVEAEPAPQADAETGDISGTEDQQESEEEPAPAGESTTGQAEPTDTPVPESTDTPPPAAPTSTPKPPTPTMAATPTPAPDAVVDAATINMRGGPGTDYQVIDSYSRGTALDVLGKSQNGSWLQVKAPGGKEGWMSKDLLSLHIALDSVAVAQAPPRPTPKPIALQPGQIAAPSLIGYQEPTFTWSWSDADKLQDQDWYFDIQLYTSSGQDPYHIITAEREDTRQSSGLWHFDAQPRLECGTVWLVQIAQRVDGNFAGWVSPKSNSLPIGPPCGDPCPGCG